MDSIQFNIDLPPDDLQRVRVDATKMGVTQSVYCAEAFNQFFQKPIAVRRAVFARAAKKITGRKVKL